MESGHRALTGLLTLTFADFTSDNILTTGRGGRPPTYELSSHHTFELMALQEERVPAGAKYLVLSFSPRSDSGLAADLLKVQIKLPAE